MDHLLPCPGCTRHVRAAEPVCPFCGEALPLSLRSRAPQVPGRRLGRAATIAFGAALAATGCSESHNTDQDAAITVDSGSSVDDDGGAVGPLYGGPPPVDAGTAPDPDAGGVVPAYGGPFPVDAGPAPEPDGGIVPPYGTPAPREDAGRQRDGGGFMTLYGGPPSRE